MSGNWVVRQLCSSLGKIFGRQNKHNTMQIFSNFVSNEPTAGRSIRCVHGANEAPCFRLQLADVCRTHLHEKRASENGRVINLDTSTDFQFLCFIIQ